jgi:hypothetical protein
LRGLTILRFFLSDEPILNPPPPTGRVGLANAIPPPALPPPAVNKLSIAPPIIPPGTPKGGWAGAGEGAAAPKVDVVCCPNKLGVEMVGAGLDPKIKFCPNGAGVVKGVDNAGAGIDAAPKLKLVESWVDGVPNENGALVFVVLLEVVLLPKLKPELAIGEGVLKLNAGGLKLLGVTIAGGASAIISEEDEESAEVWLEGIPLPNIKIPVDGLGCVSGLISELPGAWKLNPEETDVDVEVEKGALKDGVDPNPDPDPDPKLNGNPVFEEGGAPKLKFGVLEADVEEVVNAGVGARVGVEVEVEALKDGANDDEPKILLLDGVDNEEDEDEKVDALLKGNGGDKLVGVVVPVAVVSIVVLVLLVVDGAVTPSVSPPGAPKLNSGGCVVVVDGVSVGVAELVVENDGASATSFSSAMFGAMAVETSFGFSSVICVVSFLSSSCFGCCELLVRVPNDIVAPAKVPNGLVPPNPKPKEGVADVNVVVVVVVEEDMDVDGVDRNGSDDLLSDDLSLFKEDAAPNDTIEGAGLLLSSEVLNGGNLN